MCATRAAAILPPHNSDSFTVVQTRSENLFIRSSRASRRHKCQPYQSPRHGANLLDVYMNTKGAGFGPEVVRRMLLGAYVLSAGYYDAYYGKATQVRELIRQEIVQTLKSVDVILTPTATVGAPRIGEVSDPVSMYMMDIFTVPANLAGVPALSVPYGHDSTGMPLGIHIMGPHWGEGKLFTLGKEIESLR